MDVLKDSLFFQGCDEPGVCGEGTFFFFFFFNFLKKYFCHEEGAKGDVQKIIIDKIKQSAT